MAKNTHSGLFIVFEGLDGSGASNQAALLAGILAQEGYRTYLTREPSNSLIGGLIRGELTKEWQTSSLCLQLLFAADRDQHLTREIIPQLEAGKIVICDRYILSSVAYGSLDTGDIDWLKNINERFPQPNITFLIKVRPKICALRMKETRFELELYKEETKLAKIWQAYEALAMKDRKIRIIDGERDEMEIIEEITRITKKALGLSSRVTK